MKYPEIHVDSRDLASFAAIEETRYQLIACDLCVKFRSGWLLVTRRHLGNLIRYLLHTLLADLEVTGDLVDVKISRQDPPGRQKRAYAATRSVLASIKRDTANSTALSCIFRRASAWSPNPVVYRVQCIIVKFHRWILGIEETGFFFSHGFNPLRLRCTS